MLHDSRRYSQLVPTFLQWLFIVLTGLGFVGAGLVHAASSPSLCDAWDRQFQPRLTQETIPATVARLLAAHKHHGFAARFDEEKQIALLRRPLHSSGDLLFIPSHGLYRHLKKPFAQELWITPTSLYQRTPSGPTESLPLDNVPVAKSFVDAFLAVFSGSWDALHAHFQVYFSPAPASQPPRWKLGLKPTHPTMAKVIACLILEGEAERLTTLRIQEANGDLTSDYFRDSRLIPQTEWSDYHAQFNWAN